MNGASERMFAAGLPRYTHAQLQASGRPVDPDAPALRFEAFVAELLAWVRWWNTENVMPVLKGRTPLQAWLEDPTPLTTVPAADLRLLMLEDDGRTRKITTKGVAWRARQYVAAWMTGQAGREVRLRHMPHHEHEVEVFDARTGEHLGDAFLADQASPEQIAQVHRARADRRRRLATAAVPPQPVAAVTGAEAAAELADAGDKTLRAEARPGLMPPGPPAPGWVLPRAPARPLPAVAGPDAAGDADGTGQGRAR